MTTQLYSDIVLNTVVHRSMVISDITIGKMMEILTVNIINNQDSEYKYTSTIRTRDAIYLIVFA